VEVREGGLLGDHSRYGLYTRAVTNSRHAYQRLQPFRSSMTAPVASGWSVCRVGLAPTGKRRLVGCPFSPAAATHPHKL